jgi:hypothetical protein
MRQSSAGHLWPILLAALLVAACGPLPSPSPLPSPGSSLFSLSPAPSGPQASVLPPPTVTGHIALIRPFALEPADDGVWYLRGGEGSAKVGHATSSGHIREVDAGPAPLTLAAGTSAIFVLEGLPTLKPKQPRVNSVERLDPETLDVLSSAAIRGFPADLAVDKQTVWIVTTDGVLHGYDPLTLSLLQDIELTGNGPSQVTTTIEAIWVLNAEVGEDGSSVLLLHRIDREAPTRVNTYSIADASVVGVLTGGSFIWVGAGGSDLPGGEGRLYAFDRDGKAENVVRIPTPVGVTESNGWLWWATSDGTVGAVSVDGGRQRAPLKVGDGAADLVASESRLWVASDDLVILGDS